jgi:uncharacterized protein
MATILITGGSGMIGRFLADHMMRAGFDVVFLSGSKKVIPGIKTYYWDCENGIIDNNAFTDVSFIIHLAGANIGEKRWTAQRKKLILESRVNSAELLFSKVKELKVNLKAFITASAIGIYGSNTTDKIFTENDTSAPDFLGEVCAKWEAAADKFEGLGVRTVKIRTGIVLATNGGVLARLIMPFKFGVGVGLGTGKQYFPWIHIFDLANIYQEAIENSQMHGAYNAVVPEQIKSDDFLRTLAKVLNRPFWLPNIPVFVLRLLMGEMSQILTGGSGIFPKKLQDMNFKFKFCSAEEALKNLIIPKV